MAKKIKLPEGFVSVDEGEPAEDGLYLGYFIIGDDMEFIAEIQYRADAGFLYDNPEGELIGWGHKRTRRKLPIR